MPRGVGHPSAATSRVQETHHDAGTSRPYVVKLTVDVSNVVLGRCNGLQTSDDVAVWVLELFGCEGREKKNEMRGYCD